MENKTCVACNQENIVKASPLDICWKCRDIQTKQQHRLKKWQQIVPKLFHDNDESKLPPHFNSYKNKIIQSAKTNTAIHLLLNGFSGVGKTRLAASWLAFYAQMGKSIYFMDDLQFRHCVTIEERKKIIEKSSTKFALVWDDIGKAFKEKETSNAYSQAIFHIIKERLNHQLPTLITSNLEPEHLLEYFTDPALQRRIAEFKQIYVKN